jgi:hypothetical protein
MADLLPFTATMIDSSHLSRHCSMCCRQGTRSAMTCTAANMHVQASRVHGRRLSVQLMLCRLKVVSLTQIKKERLAAAEAELQAVQGREQRFWSEVVPEMRKAADVERQRRAEAEAQVGFHASPDK